MTNTNDKPQGINSIPKIKTSKKKFEAIFKQADINIALECSRDKESVERQLENLPDEQFSKTSRIMWLSAVTNLVVRGFYAYKSAGKKVIIVVGSGS